MGEDDEAAALAHQQELEHQQFLAEEAELERIRPLTEVWQEETRAFEQASQEFWDTYWRTIRAESKRDDRQQVPAERGLRRGPGDEHHHNSRPRAGVRR